MSVLDKMPGPLGDARREARANKTCPRAPIGCGEPIDETAFRDELSLTEYRQSGLCQKCQDAFFGEDEEDEDSEPPEPDGEAFRGREAADYLAEQQEAARRLK